MATMDLRPCNRGHFMDRVDAIRSTGQREWGVLEPAAVMRHLRLSIEASLGEVPGVCDRSVPVVRTLARWAFFSLLTTWPKGKIKVPDWFTPEPEGDIEEEREALKAAIDRFLAECEKDPHRKTVHEMLGPLTLAYWRHVHGVHFNHHFRQYNVV